MAITDKPTSPRGQIEHEIERLQMLSWADPGDNGAASRDRAAGGRVAGSRRWCPMTDRQFLFGLSHLDTGFCAVAGLA